MRKGDLSDATICSGFFSAPLTVPPMAPGDSLLLRSIKASRRTPENKRQLLATMTVYSGYGFAVPFSRVRHQLPKKEGPVIHPFKDRKKV